MSMLKELDTGQGWFKAGFLGFPGTGKTHTATLVACGIRKYFGLKGRIAFFDTESGSAYVAPMVRELTGMPPVGVRSRSFDDLMKFGRECADAGDDIAAVVVDSITHVWDDVLASYMRQINEQRLAKGLGPRTRMEFQDWGPVKSKFAQWTNFYLNAPMHLTVCGRAGFTYDFDQNDETGKKELVKTGVKMRAESEFGFEPSLLIEMDKRQDRAGGKLESGITIMATVLKDRFNKINGRQFDNPTFESFLPHIECLRPGNTPVIDMTPKTAVDVDESGNDQWQRERRDRVILCEEIQGEIVNRWPGQSKEEKQAKADCINAIFNTRSWTKVETMNSETLRAGLSRLRAEFVMAGSNVTASDFAPTEQPGEPVAA